MLILIIKLIIGAIVAIALLTVVAIVAIKMFRGKKTAPAIPPNGPASPLGPKTKDRWEIFLDYLTGHPKQWSVLVSWFVLNLVALSLVGDIYRSLFDPFGFWFGIQLAVIAYAFNWFPVGSDGKKGRQWVHGLITLCLVVGTIFWAFGLDIQKPEPIIKDGEEVGIKPAKITASNKLLGWQDKEVEPAGLLDGVDTWWQRRQQDKAIAEAKAKEEVWPNRRLIKAPVTDNWEDTVEIQMPSRFKGCRVTGLEPNPDGLWEMSYKDVFGPVNTYVGGGAGIRKNPIITPNAKLRFRSLEKEPLNILVQWR